MLRIPLVLALCCAFTITAASPLIEENITKANLKQPKTDTVKQYVNILEEQINVKNGSVGHQLTEYITSEASVLNSTTDQVDISESNNAGTNVITKQKTDGPGSEVEDDWWDTICNDPAADAQTLQNKNEKNIKLDEYDTRLQNITGCDTSTMTRFSGTSLPALTQRRPELRLAVRVLKADGFAHIYVELNDDRIFYFAVSSMGETLARNTYLESDDLSRFQQEMNITPQEYRQHYIPMYMKLENDELQWRVGCGNHISKGIVDNIEITRFSYFRVGVRARDYPLKMIFDCPPQTSRQHTKLTPLRA